MTLAQQIIKNQQLGHLKKNEQLVKIKLRELVFDYTNEVVEVLNKTGVVVSAVLPNDVLLTIVLKQVVKNSELRQVIAKMLLELEGHYSANGDGRNLSIVGGALSAVGSVLAGIGQGQLNNTGGNTGVEQQQFYLQKERQMQFEQDRKRRTTLIVIGISLFALIGALFVFKSMKKGQPQVQINAR